jgi:nucleoside-diphosphate-sugar epimerase
MVDVRDVCEAMFLALESPESRGAVMNLGSDGVPTLREVVLALYARAGAKPRLIEVDATLARFAVKWLSAMKLSPLAPPHLEIALRDHLFDNGLAKRLLGWQPRWTDIESALDAFESLERPHSSRPELLTLIRPGGPRGRRGDASGRG